MNIAPINTSSCQKFSGENNRKTGGGGKAFASLCIPGLGQFFDGRMGAGAIFLGGSIASWAGVKHLSKDYFNAAHKEAENLSKTGNLVDYFTKLNKFAREPKITNSRRLFWGIVVFHIVNIVDAYRGRKNSN